MKKRAKSSLFKLLAFILLIQLPWLPLTNAYGLDTETSNDNFFSAGSLDFSLSASGDFSPDTINPGETSSRELAVVKDGSLDFQYQIQAAQTAGDDAFCQTLQLEAKLDGVSQYSGDLLGLNLTPPVFLNGSQDDWQMIVSFNNNDTSLQDKTCQFSFTFAAWQTDNDGSWGFYDEENLVNSLTSGHWLPVDSQPPETTLSVLGSSWEINEKVVNGGFESGLSGWETEGEVSVIASDAYELLPYAGAAMVRIGHQESFGSEVLGDIVWENKLRQKIASGAKNISFYYNFYSFDSLGWDEPGMLVKINDVNVFWIFAGDINGGDPAFSGWRQFSFDLQGIADPVLEIIFYSGNTGSEDYQSWLYVDNVSTAEAVVSDNTIFRLTATDDLSGVAYSEYLLDGIHWLTGDSFTGADLAFSDANIYFRSVDHDGNVEEVKSRRVVKDIIQPSPVVDLLATALSKNTIVLEWLAPDDNTKRVVVYDLRYSLTPIVNDLDFSAALPVANPPAPKAPAEVENFAVTGLNSGTAYWFAIKAGDAVPNWSLISNPATAVTFIDPNVNPGEVVINELMWMGTSVSFADEYLELRNLTDQPVNLSGWQLTKLAGGVEVPLAINFTGKTIPAHGYFLIANDNSYGAVDSQINVIPNIWDSSLDLADSNLQIKLYDNFGILIDTADNADGLPAAGEAGPAYYSMERNETPGNGEEASNWHTCLAPVADLAAYWDSGFGEKGTPGGPNLSYRPEAQPGLEFFLREDKLAVGFELINISSYENLSYEIVYDSSDGTQGMVSEIEINGQEKIRREDLVLGTCSGLEGKVCVYDQDIAKISLKISLLKENGDEEILEKEIDF